MIKTRKPRPRAAINIEPGRSGYWTRILSNGRKIRTGYDVGDYPTEELAKAVIGPGSYKDFLNSVAHRVVDKVDAAVAAGNPLGFELDETEQLVLYGQYSADGQAISAPLLSKVEVDNAFESRRVARNLIRA